MIRSFAFVKLVCGVLGGHIDVVCAAIERLESLAGPADYLSLPLDFHFTDYYNNEMGAGLRRVFVSFQNLIAPVEISRIKVSTNEIEEELAERTTMVRRRVNLDPGCLTLHSFILASTKNFQHRIPAASGIYLEQELLFTKSGARPLPWTYPDYKSREYIGILREIRSIYRRQIGAIGQDAEK